MIPFLLILIWLPQALAGDSHHPRCSTLLHPTQADLSPSQKKGRKVWTPETILHGLRALQKAGVRLSSE